MNIGTLMDIARQNAQIRSDRHMANRLGIGPASISAWRRQVSIPTPEHTINLCELADIPPEVGLAWRTAWQAEGEAKSICIRIADEVTKKLGVRIPSEAA